MAARRRLVGRGWYFLVDQRPMCLLLVTTHTLAGELAGNVQVGYVRKKEKCITRVQVNGVELEYVDEGTGIPVVFSHEAGSDLHYWEPQRAAFTAHYRFVAYIRRFHGAGAWPTDGDYSTQAHVTDLLDLMRQLQAGPVHLVGFSTTIALRAALHEPALVRSLTLIEPNMPWLLERDPEDQAVLAWWRAENERVHAEAAGDRVRAATLWFELVNNRGTGTFAIQPEALRRMWHANFSAQRPAAPTPDPLTCEQLSALSLPTLILGAEYGMPYSRRIVVALANCMLASRLVVIPRVTHLMSYQAPGVFNEVVMNFLRQS